KRYAWQAPVLKGLAQGMRNRKTPTDFTKEQNLLINAVFDHPSAGVRNAAIQLLKVLGMDDEARVKAGIAKAVQIAGNKSSSDERRVEAINFIALQDPQPHSELLKQLI